MKAGNLKEASRLVEQRKAYRRLLSRLVGGEKLRFIVGEGDKASEIVTTAGYAGEVRNDLRGALAGMVEELDRSLAVIGVEP